MPDKSFFDNYGKPRQEYIDRLVAMTDGQLQKECNSAIWFSAYANNNPRSDYHWKCDAVYTECVRRGKVAIYYNEHAKLVDNC